MKKFSKIVPLHRVNEIDRWIVVPGTINENNRRRIKEINLCKNNCYFAKGVPKSIIDFIYGAVVRLKLRDRKLFFTRGTVRNHRSLMKYSVSIHELNWSVGTLITIPKILNYREKIDYKIEDCEFSIRIMELVILQGLLRLAYQDSDKVFQRKMAVRILSQGWDSLSTDSST